MNSKSKTILKAALITVAVFILQTLSYFYIAEYFGKLFGAANTLNFQLPVDRLTPWFTPLFAVYIPWVWLWFFTIPLIIYFSGGKKSFYEYNAISILMYAIGTLIYILIPTTTTPKDFIDGTIQVLPQSAMFYNFIEPLSRSADNIWGSFPSYHNFWASLFIFFALQKGVRAVWRYPMITLGVLISLSTLMLHQHCLMDVILTYSMTAAFFHITRKYNLAEKLEGSL